MDEIRYFIRVTATEEHDRTAIRPLNEPMELVHEIEVGSKDEAVDMYEAIAEMFVRHKDGPMRCPYCAETENHYMYRDGKTRLVCSLCDRDFLVRHRSGELEAIGIIEWRQS